MHRLWGTHTHNTCCNTLQHTATHCNTQHTKCVKRIHILKI